MADKYAGGCNHVLTRNDNDPLDNHICHRRICNRVTAQHSTSVVYFAWPARAC